MEKNCMLLMNMLKRSRRMRRKRNDMVLLLLQMETERRNRISALLLEMLRMPRSLSIPRPRRLYRNQGWFNCLNMYSNKRFKETVRVSRETFGYILSHIRHGLEHEGLGDSS